jgi:hypothetical protein
VTDTIGAHRPNDPRGWLLFESLPKDLQAGEDARLYADRELVRDDFGASSFERPASVTEKLLLEHLGYTLPEKLFTHVRWLSIGVRSRSWPQLANQGDPA